VANRDPRVAEVSWFLDIFLGARRVGAGAGGAGMAVHALDTVRGSQPAEAVPLHDPREAAALADTGHVDVRHGCEQLDRERLPLAHLGGSVLADLTDEALGLGVDL